MSNLNISQWGNWLQNISDNHRQLLVRNEQGNIQVVDRKNIPKDFKRLTIEQIINITLETFEKSNEVKEMDSTHIINGLKALKQRSEKYKYFYVVRNFFLRKKINPIEENATKIDYFTSLMKANHQYRDVLLKDLERTPVDLSPEVLELGVATLLKDPKISNAFSNQPIIYQLCEKAAQKYLKNGELDKACRVRMLAASQLGPSPLCTTISAIDHQHVGNLDTGILKNGSLHIRKMEIDGKPYTQLMFKVNLPERERLDATLKSLGKEKGSQELLSSLPKDFCDRIEVNNEVKDGYYHLKSDHLFESDNGYYLGKATNIRFGNVGEVRIGNDSSIYTQYNRVQILISSDMDENKIGEAAHIMLSAMGLGGIALPQREIDDERMKIFHLLRYFYPDKARAFETNGYYFSIPIQQLKQQISEKVPEMQGVFEKYLIQEPELMYKQEVYPGKEIWAIQHEADAIRKAGGVGLMSGVGNARFKEDAFQTVAKMLEKGALSSQDRFENGWFVKGASSETDLRVGGGDHVFTRLVTENRIKGKNPIQHYQFYGAVQVLYDLNLLERGGYAYKYDLYGSKQREAYQKRLNFVDITKDLNKIQNDQNEFMIKNRIPPQFIKGVIVQKEEDKEALLKTLRQSGRIEEREGQEFIKDLDVLATNFIHVSETFQMDMWGVPEKDLPLTEGGQ